MRWLVERVRAGLGARAGSAVLLGALAAIVAVVATATPILLGTAQQAQLDRALGTAPALDRSVVGLASTTTQVRADVAGDDAALVPDALGGSSLWTPTRTFLEENDDPLTLMSPRVGDTRPKTRLAAVSTCAGLRFTSGRCPGSGDEVAIADATAARGLRLGQRLELTSASITTRLVVVGVYDSSTPAGRLAGAPGRLAGVPHGVLDPDVLVAPARFAVDQVPTTAYSFRTLRTSVPLTALPSIRRSVARAERVPVSAAAAQSGTRAVAPLTAVLDRVEQQSAVVAAILAVVAVGAFGLAWLAFGAVAQRLARVRAAEWALPRLRGLPRRRRLGARLVEPFLALLIGTVLGTAATVAVAFAIAGPTTRDAVRAAVPGALGLAAAASLGGVVALLWVSLLADRRPLDEQLRRATEPGQLSRAGLVGEAVVVVAALAAVAALLTESGAGIEGAGLLAPALIALAVGFVGLQAALLVVRRRTRVLPRSLVGLVVWRRLGRAPSQLLAAVLVGAAIALTVFVSVTSATADEFADATAAAEVAAPVVLHVRTPTGLTVLDAVRRADPTGHRAMAAEEVRAGEGAQRVLALDTARLAAVSTWRPEWADLDAAELRRRLAPPVVPSAHLMGRRLTVDLDDLRQGAVTSDPDPRFTLVATVQTPVNVQKAELGPFGIGAGRTLTAPIPCADGCTLVSLAVKNAASYPDVWSLHMRVTGLSTELQPRSASAAVLRRPGSWIADAGHDFDETLPRSIRVHPGPAGLAVDLADGNGAGTPGVRVKDTVEPLPALFGAATRADPFPGAEGTVLGTALDDSSLLLRMSGRASDLPRLLGDGVVVDLPRMLPQMDRADPAPDLQVWIRGDPAPIERRLRAEGVVIRSTETLRQAAAEQRAEAGPAAARASFVGAAGAALIVLLALIGGRLLGVPDRRRQWRSFAAAGVPVARLRRLVAVEFLAPGAAAVLVGTLSGAAAFVLAMRHLPLADLPPDGPPAGLLIPWGPVLLVPLVALLVVVAAALLIARVETARVGEGGAR